MNNEMEMPTPCIHCGEIFELLDGYGSEKWHPNTTICEACYKKEEKEIEMDDEIQEQKERLENAIFDVKDAIKYLKEWGVTDIVNPFETQSPEPMRAVLPTDEEVKDWYSGNIDADCPAGSAIFKFRQFLNSRQHQSEGEKETIKS